MKGKIDSFESAFDVPKLKAIALQGGFYSYLAGTAAVMIMKYTNNKNISTRSFQSSIPSTSSKKFGIYIINYLTTLPMKKGLSSSAALCVLIAKCFNEVSTVSYCCVLLVLCCVLFCCVVLVLCCVLFCRVVLCSILLCCVVFYSVVLCCVLFCCVVLYRSVVSCCVVLCCL